MRIHRWLISCFLTGTLLVGGCAAQNGSQSTATSPTADETAAQATVSPTSETTVPFGNLPRLDGQATVEMVVKGTPIVIQVDGSKAPITAGNFVDLVNRGVYDGLAFHRVVREPQPFVVQGGDPQSKDPSFSVEQLGTGGFIDPATSATRYIPLEIEPEGADQPVYSKTLETSGVTEPPKLQHIRGAVAMARSSMPDSASSQFYVALSDLDFLDGNYAVFGNVTSGMEVVDQIQQGDRITSARVTAGIENLKPGQ